ncbi:hypothetical protein Tco_0115453 [Tanacetum coccineum]
MSTLDPYEAIRQACLVETDTESEPFEDFIETETPHTVASPTLLLDSTPPACHVEELEDSNTSGARSTSSDSTTPMSPDHPLTCTLPTPTPTRASFHHRTARMTVWAQPVMSPGHSARVTEGMDLSDSAFRKRYRSSYETPSSSSSLAFLVRKRYQDDEGHGLDDEGHGFDEKVRSVESDVLGLEGDEEAVPEGQQRAALVVETADGSTYIDVPAYPLPTPPAQTPPSPEWSSSSLPVSPTPSAVPSPISSPMISLTIPSPIASPMATPTATILVDEAQLIEIGAQLELYEGILQDHTQRLDVMPPTLFMDIDRDVRELYTRALWRPVLALEAWAGHVDTRMADMSWAGYDDHRLIHDMLV